MDGGVYYSSAATASRARSVPPAVRLAHVQAPPLYPQQQQQQQGLWQAPMVQPLSSRGRQYHQQQQPVSARAASPVPFTCAVLPGVQYAPVPPPLPPAPLAASAYLGNAYYAPLAAAGGVPIAMRRPSSAARMHPPLHVEQQQQHWQLPPEAMSAMYALRSSAASWEQPRQPQAGRISERPAAVDVLRSGFGAGENV
jgi:hypothetical protein